MIREGIILKYIHNKDVLDVGSIGQTDKYSLWDLYKQVQIKSLTGIDLQDASKTAKSTFHSNKDVIASDKRVVYGNMENHNLGREFDVVVAGDVLEHVDNQGLFLDNIHRHLREDGTLIITTPNAKWINVIFRPNPTHTLWHDRYTLIRILDCHGFRIVYFRYYYGNKKHYPFILRPFCLRQGMIAVCTKKKV